MTERRTRSDPGLDAESFRHDRSPYERPTERLRCGRAALWSTPCQRGPNPDGSCGGTADCQPARGKADRYECRRPVALGGPCAEGPMPDGSCARRRPACAPRPTLRSWRGRLTFAALSVVIALIAAFSGQVGIGKTGVNFIDPGPLYGPHAGFAPKAACVTCHDAHGGGVRAFWSAVFQADGMTENCTSCHGFAGDVRAVHNVDVAARPDLPTIACNQCHREHRGADAEIARIGDSACAGCHAMPIGDFAAGHPPFPDGYPHFQEASIKFDHVSHINKHFSDPKVADKAPGSCADCHDVTTATSAVVPRGYVATCDACHGNQIVQRDIVLLRLPEFASNQLDAEAVTEVCGPTLDAFEHLQERMEALEGGEPMPDEEGDEEYEAVSLDEMTPLASYLLDVATDDMESYEEPMQSLVMAMAEEGTAPLAALVEDRLGAVAPKLLAGLNPELVKRVACAWAANVEYEPPADPEMGGWFGDYLELRYRPAGHGDAVARGWIEAALQAPDDDLGEGLRAALIDPGEAPGACVKCHAVHAAGDEGALAIAWRFSSGDGRPHHIYSHRTHLSLVQAGEAAMARAGAGCQVCHKLDPRADFAQSFDDFDPTTFTSGFEDIGKETCAACHGERAVRADCQLCHRYHLEATFKPDMLGAALSQE